MTAPSIKETLERLLFTAKILQQNSVGCATNHYGHDCELNGLPGWLTDTQKDIDAATTALATLSPPAGELTPVRVRTVPTEIEPGIHWMNSDGVIVTSLEPPAGERREAIARWLFERFMRGHAQWYQMTEPNKDDWRKDADNLILASGLVQDEAGWKPITTAPKDGTRILWSCGDDKMSVIHWPEYDLCFEGGYWMPLPAPPIRSARDGGAEG